jgi:hypothetical protein
MAHPTVQLLPAIPSKPATQNSASSSTTGYTETPERIGRSAAQDEGREKEAEPIVSSDIHVLDGLRQVRRIAGPKSPAAVQDIKAKLQEKGVDQRKVEDDVVNQVRAQKASEFRANIFKQQAERGGKIVI